MNRQVAIYSVAAGVGAIGLSVGLCLVGRKLVEWFRGSHGHSHGHSHGCDFSDEESINALMGFHYTPAEECVQFPFGPKDSGEFPKRCAELCLKHMQEGVLSRALDVGCGPGGVTFELARGFSEVVGLDVSHLSITKCQELKLKGQKNYWLSTEGSLREEKIAIIDPSIDRNRVQFVQGDACNLPNLGQFGCLFIGNALHHLPNPMAFLDQVSDILVPGGILVIADFYFWTEEHLAKENWLGGYVEDGREVHTFDSLKQILEPKFNLVDAVDLPFLARQSKRLFYWGVDHATVWRRKH